jgi:exopolysaccharide production protein ExoZ
LPPCRSPSAPKTYFSVQILRAVAALMVVGLHATLQAQYFGGAWFFGLGNAGVDIFFPISGFVMVVSTKGRVASAANSARFAMARLMRIAPIYYLFTLAKAAAAAVHPSLFPAYAFSLKGLAAALLFIPYYDAPPIKQGWTLNLEMFYYALIAVVLMVSPRIALYVPLLIVGIVIVAKLAAPNLPVLAVGWGAPLALEFAAGMLIGQMALSKDWAGRLKWLALAAGLLIYALVPIEQWGRVIAWGVPGALFLWAAIGFERTIAGRSCVGFLALLGDASYSIYLTHAISQPALAALTGRALTASLGPAVLVALLVVVPTTIGIGFHLLVEKPLTRGLKRAMRSGSRYYFPAFTSPQTRQKPTA